MDVPLYTAFNLDDPSLVSVLDELPLWSAPFGIKLLEKIIPQKNMRVLDIGYGTGFPIIELAMRFGNSCKVFGIDPWQAASDRAREKIRMFGINNIELLTPVSTQNNIAETQNIASQQFIAPSRLYNSIDLVISNNGLNNVSDMDGALGECARVLKPGGKLLFTMNLEDTMIEFYEVMEAVLTDHKLNASIEDMKKHIYEKRKPLEEVQSLLIKNGFSDISIDHDHFAYTFADGTAMFRHFFIRLAFLGPWLEIVPEERREEIFDEIELRINRMSDEEGHFRLSVPFAAIDARKK